MNRKGQALVEFVLVLPILIFLLLAFVDIGKLMIMKNHLESLIGEVKIDTTSVEDLEYEIKVIRVDEGSEVIVSLESCYDVITPGIGKIIGDPACVSASRVFLEENYEEN